MVRYLYLFVHLLALHSVFGFVQFVHIISVSFIFFFTRVFRSMGLSLYVNNAPCNVVRRMVPIICNECVVIQLNV